MINLPKNIDILYIRTTAESSMRVHYADKEYGPYPVEGALGLAAEEMQRDHPDVWPTVSDCGTALTFTHFAFMSANKNATGMDYPVTEVAPE